MKTLQITEANARRFNPDDYECLAGVCPDLSDEEHCENCSLKRLKRSTEPKEALRWRDPKEELPEEGVDVFVKMIRSGEYGEETIYTSSHVVNNFYHDSESNPFGCEGYYPAGNGGRVRVTVIGWRPIE